MRKCVRCGNEIDVISKDPNKVFYCNTCSFEVLKQSSGMDYEDETEEYKTNKKAIYYIFPGLICFQKNNIIDAVFYLITFIFLVLFLITYLDAPYFLKAAAIINLGILYIKNIRIIREKK